MIPSEQVKAVLDLFISECGRTCREMKQTFSCGELARIEEIVTTGCGYSYAASLYAKDIFEQIAGVRARAECSIDASRHLPFKVLPDKERCMFIGISNSGIVARIAEAMERFERFGALTVAYTGDRSSRCAAHAKRVVDLSCGMAEGGPPLAGYAMTLLQIYALAWSIREAKAPADKLRNEAEKELFYRELKRTASQLKDDEMINRVMEFTALVKDAAAYEFVGSGSGYASAWLGRQETVGQAGKLAIETSAEDWLHSTFLYREPERMATLVFAPSYSPARSRLGEVMGYMERLKRPLCVITDEKEIAPKGAFGIQAPYKKWMEPVVDLAVVSLFAGTLCELTGETCSRGFRKPWDFSKNGYATEFSEIQIIE